MRTAAKPRQPFWGDPNEFGDDFCLTPLANGLEFIASGLRELAADGPTGVEYAVLHVEAELSSSQTCSEVGTNISWL
jgi:hypothetical protein